LRDNHSHVFKTNILRECYHFRPDIQRRGTNSPTIIGHATPASA
jgi:hypothetical protein